MPTIHKALQDNCVGEEAAPSANSTALGWQEGGHASQGEVNAGAQGDVHVLVGVDEVLRPGYQRRPWLRWLAFLVLLLACVLSCSVLYVCLRVFRTIGPYERDHPGDSASTYGEVVTLVYGPITLETILSLLVCVIIAMRIVTVPERALARSDCVGLLSAVLAAASSVSTLLVLWCTRRINVYQYTPNVALLMLRPLVLYLFNLVYRSAS